MALTSALESFLDHEPRGGYAEGRDGVSGVEDLFGMSLMELAAQHPSDTYNWNGAWKPVASDPYSIPTATGRLPQEVIDSICDILEADLELNEEQEKLDAYDRAMSIL